MALQESEKRRFQGHGIIYNVQYCRKHSHVKTERKNLGTAEYRSLEAKKIKKTVQHVM